MGIGEYEGEGVDRGRKREYYGQQVERLSYGCAVGSPDPTASSTQEN